MDLSISARNFELTEALNEYARDKLSHLDKYARHIIDGHLVLEQDKGISIVELVLVVKHATLNSKVTNPDLYIGITDAIKKVERQLIKYEAKFRERKRLARKTRRP